MYWLTIVLSWPTLLASCLPPANRRGDQWDRSRVYPPGRVTDHVAPQLSVSCRGREPSGLKVQ
jgi:hypothetical protein